MKKFIKNILNNFNYSVVKTQTLERLQIDQKKAREFNFILSYHPDVGAKCIKFRHMSTSQINQDIFVLAELGFKSDGFFVEFGATDGISMSNSYLLEKEFNWNGILAEPGKCWHKELEKNRSVSIEKNCVWHKTGETLKFQETGNSTLSTITGFGHTDPHSQTRIKAKEYKVSTISLNDLLSKYNAPKLIDYLSIDTEGSEYVILESLNFDVYKFRVITVEHNYTELRDKIYKLLTSKGYKRVHNQHSLFDDWYVLKEQNYKGQS